MTGTILYHKGLLTFSSIDNLLTQFRLVAQEHEIKFPVYKRILTVMIESLENIYKYSDVIQEFVHENETYLPTFKLSMSSSSIRLETSNPVLNDHLKPLIEKIDLVNRQDKEELKQMYIETITNGKFSPKGGAGLGFIEMARSSGNPLRYSVKKISKDFSMYTFVVTFRI